MIIDRRTQVPCHPSVDLWSHLPASLPKLRVFITRVSEPHQRQRNFSRGGNVILIPGCCEDEPRSQRNFSCGHASYAYTVGLRNAAQEALGLIKEYVGQAEAWHRVPSGCGYPAAPPP